ncbi:MAG TPA: radical SAM protein [bacterium]|nr:radical SAM protein [bacterium]
MLVLLIYPPVNSEKFIASTTPPLGLAYLASFVRSQMPGDCKVLIWDLNLHIISKEQFKEKLLKLDEKPEVIGIGGIVTVFKSYLWISKICKEIFPDALLIAGGSLAGTIPHLLFKHSPVDICVRGEGEFTLLEIIKTFKDGGGKKDMQHIKGIFLWDEKKGSLLETPSRPRISNLDILGIPAYDLLDIEQYDANATRNRRNYAKDLPPQVYSPGNLRMSLMTSRGCIGRCTFCYRHFSAIKMNSSEFVKKHIMLLHNRFGVNVFEIMDELFNISEKRVNELIACFQEMKQRIPRFCFSIGGARADLINIELLRRLKEAGCFQIIYGLESGSPKILRMIKKGVTVEQNRRAVLATRDAGLCCVPQFVVGLPGEDRDTLIETLRFAKSIDFWSYLSFHWANAYPGSEIYQYAKEKKLIKDEFSYVSSLSATCQYPLQLANISQKEMIKILRKYFTVREIRLIFKNNNFLIAIYISTIWFTKKVLGYLFNKIKKLFVEA